MNFFRSRRINSAVRSKSGLFCTITIPCDAGHSRHFSLPPQSYPVMARRSLGVVLIVALLGWTVSVNQPLLACTGKYSRAAVGVPAGASPAHKPEPSPSRHSCCPPEGKSSAVAQPSVSSICLLHMSHHRDCCSLSRSRAEVPFYPLAPKPRLVKFVVTPLAPFLPGVLGSNRPLLAIADCLPLPQYVSKAVLRL